MTHSPLFCVREARRVSKLAHTVILGKSGTELATHMIKSKISKQMNLYHCHVIHQKQITSSNYLTFYSLSALLKTGD